MSEEVGEGLGCLLILLAPFIGIAILVIASAVSIWIVSNVNI